MSEARDQWLATIKEWEASNITQADFCRERDIKKVTFGYWRKRFIASGECESRAIKTCPTDEASVSGFIPLKVVGDDVSDGELSSHIIEIALPHGITLRIPCDARSAL